MWLDLLRSAAIGMIVWLFASSMFEIWLVKYHGYKAIQLNSLGLWLYPLEHGLIASACLLLAFLIFRRSRRLQLEDERRRAAL